LHVLPRHVTRIIAPPADEPFYPYYGDRLSRLVVLPGAAARIAHGIALGAAVNVLASFADSIHAAEGMTPSFDARVAANVPSVARLIAGAQWQIDPALRVGLVYRQRFVQPVQLSTRTVVGQFTPHTLAAGVVWSSDAFAAGLDLAWAKWSGYPGPLTLRVPFKDTFGVRAGLESVTDEGLVYRGGYAFESSPVPDDQTGVTNLLDGHKHAIAFGLGYVLKRVRIDAHGQVQLVSTRTSAKAVWNGDGEYDPYTSLRDETNPGYPSLKSGGEVFSGGVTVTVPL
jgi:long-subunit fatty acid transport protein